MTTPPTGPSAQGAASIATEAVTPPPGAVPPLEGHFSETTVRRGRGRAARRFRRSRAGVVSLVLLGLLGLAAIAVPLVSRHAVDSTDLLNRLQGSSAAHPLGTDQSGRDVLVRLTYAGRISLSIGLLAALVAIPLGTFLGVVAGAFGGVVDSVLMRVTDAMLAIPLFFLLLIVLGVFRPSLASVVLVIGLTTWMGVARLVRADVLRIRTLDFVVASRAGGLSEVRVLTRHVVPHALPTVIVAATFAIPEAMLLEAALSYFGLGVQPPTPTWGNMLGEAQAFFQTDPLLAVWPGVALLVTVMCFNTLGESLRRALKPREAE